MKINSFKISKQYVIILVIVISNQLFSQNKIEEFHLQSEFLKETRSIHVSLPEQYDLSSKIYPLVLVMDHDLLFNTTAAITTQLSRTSRMPESIVVSISTGSKHRNYYAPNLYNNHRDRPYNYGNHQEEFLNFIEKELLPSVEENYRIAKFKTIIGFSPSSVFSIYSLLTKPYLFQAYICFASGNIIGDGYSKDERLIEELEQLYSKLKYGPNYLYVVSGSKDAENQPYIETNVKDFNHKLSKYNSKNIHIKAEVIEGEGHTDVILPGLISALDFVFPKGIWVVDYLDLIERPGSAKDNISKFYNDLSRIYGFAIYPNADRLYSMSCLKNIGKRLLATNKTDEAIDLFKYWTQLYPKAHLPFYYLGMSYNNNDDDSEATTAFKKAEELSAANEKSNKSQLKKKNGLIEKHLYLGEKPPGSTPRVFASGLVSMKGRFESTISFSPDLKEMYFEAKNEGEVSQIYYTKFIDGAWSAIQKANFTRGLKKEEMHPFLSPDGKRIYFTAFDDFFSDERIWFSDRLEQTWSEAKKLQSTVNNDPVFYANHGHTNRLYYFNLSDFKTYAARHLDGKLVNPKVVPIEKGHHAFISKQDDYLLVTAKNSEDVNRQDNDIYVYFKKQDGTWSDPINLGPKINSSFSEKTPTISPDGKYLFFGRDERSTEPGLSDIYWVSTEVIEQLRPKE